MLDILLNAFRPGEFLLALAGQLANETSARFTLSVAKSVGMTVLGLAAERSVPTPVKPRRRKQTKRRPAAKRATAPSRRRR